MKEMKMASLEIFFLLVLSIAAFVSPLGCETVTTGPQVTQEEIRREEQTLEIKKQRYSVKKRPVPVGISLAQQEKMVKTVGSKVLKQVEDSVKIDFQIQESEAVNAGATIGKIVVTTGMISFLKSEDELAIVIGHEIAHLVKGHITKSIISNIPVIIGSVLAESAAPGSGRVVEMGGSIFTQKFSRDMEREADYFGIQYAHKAGFDAVAGIEIWERFAIELPETQRATIFSSHPSSTERMVRAKKIAESLQGTVKTK